MVQSHVVLYLVGQDVRSVPVVRTDPGLLPQELAHSNGRCVHGAGDHTVHRVRRENVHNMPTGMKRMEMRYQVQRKEINKPVNKYAWAVYICQVLLGRYTYGRFAYVRFYMSSPVCTCIDHGV